MRCPYCLNEESSVVESRVMVGESGVRRRRACTKCKKRFTTYERVGNVDLKVLKRDGRKEGFDRGKLEKGIAKACWKRGVEEGEVVKLIDEIEAKLLGRKSTVVKSSDIGNMVLSRLRRIDPVAYLRFASVYLEFEKITDFKRLVAELEQKQDYQFDEKKDERSGNRV